MSALLQPTPLSPSLTLRNRIVMSSLTRNRNTDNLKPGPTNIEYYTQRATAGLIITEGILVNHHEGPWPYLPVLCDEAQMRAWAKVVDAVHAEGGKIFFQTWHAGSNRGMGVEDVREAVGLFRRSVELGRRAGFDGVEILAQGGFLVHSFLCSNLNHRTDIYGGPTPNRCRFLLETLDSIVQIYPHDRIGIKLCPTDFLNGTIISHQEMTEVYTYLIDQLVQRGVGYINISRRGAEKAQSIEGLGVLERPDGKGLRAGYEPLEEFGPLVKGPGSRTKLMANDGYEVAEAEDLVSKGELDFVSFGRAFIYNPDLVRRIKDGLLLAGNDRGSGVNYGRAGNPLHLDYTDWPTAVDTQVEVSQ